MRHLRKLLLGLALLLCVSFSFGQDYSGRTINIQPLIPYTGLQTGDAARAINASQTVTYGQAQNGIQSIDVQYQFKVSELEARIVQLEQLNADAQNRIAALEAAHNSLVSQVANLSQSGTTTNPPPVTNPTQPTSSSSSSGNSYLQVGAFTRLDLAGQLVFKLQQLGYTVYDSSSNGVTKLFVGPFANAFIPEEQYRLSLQNIRDSFPVAAP